MAINSFTFNGVNSLEYGLYVSGNQTFNSAEKDYTKVSVPGRSGDLLIFNDRYKNVNVNYPAILFDDYEESAMRVRAWLLSTNGYCRLEDSYHPDEYRIASFSGPIDFDTLLLKAGQTTLTFDCKPQRWLKSGDKSTICFQSGTTYIMRNPTMFNSKPIVTVRAETTYTIKTSSTAPSDWETNYTDYYTFNGSTYVPVSGDSAPEWQANTYYKKNAAPCVLSIGSYTVTISDVNGSVTIDSDMQDAYNGSENRNPTVTLANGFPELVPGVNEISFSGTGIISVEVTPKWWTL